MIKEGQNECLLFPLTCEASWELIVCMFTSNETKEIDHKSLVIDFSIDMKH